MFLYWSIVCCSRQSKVVEVVGWSPPWHLLSDRRSARTNRIVPVACRRGAVLF
jgi:hypothetical protein